MQIDRLYYPVLTLGFGRRVVIWTIGCPHACPACSNPELWKPDPSRDLQVSDIIRTIQSIKDSIDGVTITGGEPFMQVSELAELVASINISVTEDIIIYSGFTLKYLQCLKDERVDSILNHTAVLIDGSYRDELNDEIGLRGSSNQRIHIFNPRYEDRRFDFEKGKRQVQNIFWDNTVFSIGIPHRNFRSNISGKLTKFEVFGKIGSHK